MNELDIIDIIHKKLDITEFLGNDCAELSKHDLTRPLHITQDSLIEGVHFLQETISPYQLGKKAVAVNVSDLCAAFALPKYLSIALSMPENTSPEFVSELYSGINDACSRFGCIVVGGDLTRSEKIVISICAIGQQKCLTSAGRDKAESGDAVILIGQAGASAIGLLELQENSTAKTPFTEAHLNPETAFDAIVQLSLLNIKTVGAMDTSDGIADAIYKISYESQHRLEIDGDKIPVLKGFEARCEHFGLNARMAKLFGGEDFALLMTLSPKYLKELSQINYTIIGKVCEFSKSPISVIKFAGEKDIILTEECIKTHTFQHFGKNSFSGEENHG